MTDLDAVQIESSPLPGLTMTELAGVALLATAVLVMVAGVIQAVTTPAVPTLVGGQIGRVPFQVPQLSLSFADRLSIFARSGANLTVALVLAVAIVTAARRVRALMLVSAILASIVILANLAVGFEILRNATGAFSGSGETNRAAGLLQCLAPVALSIGVWVNLGGHQRANTDNRPSAGPPTWTAAG